MARFYAACLASYNAGRLYGAWLHLDTDPEVMGEAVQAMLKASPVPGAEEWAVHDYDGVPSSLGEYPGLDGLAAAAELLEAAEEMIGEGGAYDLAKAALDNFSGDTDEALECVRHKFLGRYEDLEDYGAQSLECQLEAVPESLRSYVDVESWARDQELGGDIWTARVDGGLLVFSNH
jgi:antirestriction protein